jgi:putative PEP-CTERM system TPR-repeat lipoprotein
MRRFMRRASTISFVVAAAILAGAVYVALHPADLLGDARVRLARGDLRAAQLDLDSYLKGHPHNPQASFQLGLVDLAQGNGASAARNLQVARDGGYDARAIIVPLGRAYLLQRHFDAALTDFTRDAAPADAASQVLAVRALAYLGLRQMQNARDAAAEAVRRDPDDAAAGLASAQVDFTAGRWQAAQDAIAHVLARHPGTPEALLLRADITLAQGDAAGALTQAHAAMAQMPVRLDATLAAARALIVLHRDEEAIALLEAVGRAAPRRIDVPYLRAILAVRHQDFATADTQLAAISPSIDALKLGPYLLAVTKLARGQPAQAEEAAAAYALHNPADPQAAKLLALTELANNRPGRAEAALRNLIESGKPDADTLDLQARALSMQGSGAEAARNLTLAAALAPRDIDVLNRLAAARLGLGDTVAGADALRLSLAAAPDQPAAASALVQSCLAAGDFAGARDVAARLRRAGETEMAGVLTGQIAAASLDDAGARQAYAAVLRQFPASRAATFGLINLDRVTGDSVAARGRLAAWMHAHPTDRDGLALAIAAWRGPRDVSFALALAEAAHAADPGDRQFTETLARLYLGIKAPQRAVALLDRAPNRATDAGDSNLLDLQAEAQAQNGDAEEAKRLFLQAADAQPRNPGPRLGLTALYVGAGAYGSARAVMADALAANPGEPRLLAASVAVEQRASGLDAALAKAASLRADPANLPAAWPLAGDVLAAAGDQPDAAAAYAAAYRAAPSGTLAIDTAASLARAGHPASAIELLTAWVGVHPGDAAALQVLASLSLTAHRTGDAGRWLDQLLALRQNNVMALNNDAWVKLEQGDVAAARRLAQRAYIIAPGPATQDTLGWIMARQGETAAALPLLQQAASVQPDPAILYHTAFLLKAMGHRDEARAAVDRALSDPAAFDERGAAEALRTQLR